MKYPLRKKKFKNSKNQRKKIKATKNRRKNFFIFAPLDFFSVPLFIPFRSVIITIPIQIVFIFYFHSLYFFCLLAINGSGFLLLFSFRLAKNDYTHYDDFNVNENRCDNENVE